MKLIYGTMKNRPGCMMVQRGSKVPEWILSTGGTTVTDVTATRYHSSTEEDAKTIDRRRSNFINSCGISSWTWIIARSH